MGSSLFVPNNWTLEEALTLIRSLQPEAKKLGYHICLGGGVLNRGSSEKDLDLYFISLDNRIAPKSQDLVAWLDKLWGEGKGLFPPVVTDVDVAARILVRYPTPPEHSPYAAKLKYTYSGLRIDVFVLGGDRIERAMEESGPRAGTAMPRATVEPRRVVAQTPVPSLAELYAQVTTIGLPGFLNEAATPSLWSVESRTVDALSSPPPPPPDPPESEPEPEESEDDLYDGWLDEDDEEDDPLW